MVAEIDSLLKPDKDEGLQQETQACSCISSVQTHNLVLKGYDD